MDFKFFGLIDIIIVLGLLIFMILGFKKGAIKKLLSLVGVLAILIFSIFYCSQFAGFLKEKNLIYPNLYEKFYANALAASGITETSTAEEVMSAALGVPAFLAKIIVKAMGNIDPSELVSSVCQTAAMWVTKVIAFGILFFGLLIILAILKLIATILRQNTFIRIVDGILGIILYAAIFLVICTALFAVLRLVMDTWGWVKGNSLEWLCRDMAIQKNPETGVYEATAFRISGTFYLQNFFVSIFKIFGL